MDPMHLAMMQQMQQMQQHMATLHAQMQQMQQQFVGPQQQCGPQQVDDASDTAMGSDTAGPSQQPRAIEEVFVSRDVRKRRRLMSAHAAELALLQAEETTRAKEDRVQAAGRKAYLVSILQDD